MPRTTINLDPSVLDQLKLRQHQEHKPLSDLVNQLLVQALAETEPGEGTCPPLRWTSTAMHARIDLEDKDALMEALDRP